MMILETENKTQTRSKFTTFSMVAVSMIQGIRLEIMCMCCFI